MTKTAKLNKSNISDISDNFDIFEKQKRTLLKLIFFYNFDISRHFLNFEKKNENVGNVGKTLTFRKEIDKFAELNKSNYTRQITRENVD